MALQALGTMVLLSSLLCATALAAPNLVANGDFEKDANGAPEAWSFSGDARVKQQLVRDAGREGRGSAAKLVCTEFSDGLPSSHAMLCQVGVVALQSGKWYRLAFWAKGEGIRGGAVNVAISNTRTWQNPGLSDGVTVRGQWRQYELLFRATENLPAEESRLQFWFGSTGTFWLDDVELTETDIRPQWHPQLRATTAGNCLPNSSFECGAAGWGSYSPDLRYWHGNVYRLIGEEETRTAAHGKSSLRLPLTEKDLPTYFFDYFDPVRQPVRCVVTAHHGWVPVEPGKAYTLSAYLKADAPDRVGVLFVRQAGGRALRQDVKLTTEWQRYTFSFTPDTGYVWTGVGGDLAASGVASATVWLDAVQLEAGAEATPYRPLAPVEVMASVDAPGDTVVDVGRRTPPMLPVQVRGYNNGERAQSIQAALTVTDFFDRPAPGRSLLLALPPKGGAAKVERLGGLGFLRVKLEVAGAPPQELRCAILRAYRARDSRFGLNHAYPWDFLLPLAHQAGITWWRDWTTQWRTVQPEAGGAFDFREPDAQIDRVLRQRGSVVGLFPFPSSAWCSTADDAAVAKIAKNDYEKARVPLAFKPKDEGAFSRYIGESVRHYRDRLTVYQVFNEALYTSYSLPASAGHTMDDYVRLARLAHDAIKAEQPGALVLGGLGIWADSRWTRDFVEAGGLKWVDALDLHLYPKGDPEPYADSLAKLWARMKERGEAKPIWLTELGCYADDDPAVTPFAANFGDSAMRRALHPSEREASEWLVKFATLFFANGGEKLFLHAGTCGEINGQDAGGIFFEYGGAPRKMLPAVATLSGLLPPEVRFEKSEALAEGVTAHWFSTPGRRVGVAWSADGSERRLPAGTLALDLMGNQIRGEVSVSGTPVYLVAK